MRQDLAEEIICRYLKPIYAFSLKRCSTPQDAEDLSQEIVMKLFRSLLTKEEIENIDKYVWTIAHHTLCNYYREKNTFSIGTPIEDMADYLPSGENLEDTLIKKETLSRLHSEIAYLSKTQRRVVIAYYFENKKQEDIAKELNIPLGTVKWHLFEAKKDLKEGMNTMRTSELKFNPIKFAHKGISGQFGTIDSKNYFRSALAENIGYCVKDTAKSINEIASELGVSPVYIENEVEYLEEMCLLLKKGDKYIINFILDEPTNELLRMEEEMYKKASALFANELYDELVSSGILDDERIISNQGKNFALWSVIPFICSASGDFPDTYSSAYIENDIFTYRPDGARNVFTATVYPYDLVLTDTAKCRETWCGPCWNGDGKNEVFQIDSCWSEERIKKNYMAFSSDTSRALSLYEKAKTEKLYPEDWAWLAERGFVKTNGETGDGFKATWQIVILCDNEIKEKLINIGNVIREKHRKEFEALKAPYAKALTDAVPEHMKKVQDYINAFIFNADGFFIYSCLKALVDSGKLREPTEEEKKTLTTLIIPFK